MAKKGSGIGFVMLLVVLAAVLVLVARAWETFGPTATALPGADSERKVSDHGQPEAADALRRYGEGLDMDPARQEFVENRLDAVGAIARKHRVEPEDITSLHEVLV